MDAYGKRKTIVFCTDNRYADITLLAIKDAWEYCNKSVPIHLVHDSSFLKANLEKIDSLRIRHKIDVRTLEIPETEVFYKEIKTGFHATSMTYATLLLSRLFKDDYDFVYYMDGDILIMRSLVELLHIEPEEPIAVVDHRENAQYQRIFGEDGKYVNIGVMVVNVDKWEQENILERSMFVIENEPHVIKYASQDVLMRVLKDDWFELPLEMNFMLSGKNNPYVEKNDTYDWDPSKIDPMIVHFVGPKKPWNSTGIESNTHKMWRSRFKVL